MTLLSNPPPLSDRSPHLRSTSQRAWGGLKEVLSSAQRQQMYLIPGDKEQER